MASWGPSVDFLGWGVGHGAQLQNRCYIPLNKEKKRCHCPIGYYNYMTPWSLTPNQGFLSFCKVRRFTHLASASQTDMVLAPWEPPILGGTPHLPWAILGTSAEPQHGVGPWAFANIIWEETWVNEQKRGHAGGGGIRQPGCHQAQ